MPDEVDFSDFGSEEDLEGYDHPVDGIYHVVVNGADDSREKVTGVRVDLQVLAGTAKGQVGKKAQETFWDPSPEHKDNGRFATKRIAKFAIAAGLITPEQLGKPGVAINWEQAVGRQLVVKLVGYERKDKETGKTYRGANIDGLEMYTVRHPSVAQVPKDAEALALVPEAAAPAASVAPTTAQSGQPPQQTQQPTGAASGSSEDWSKI